MNDVAQSDPDRHPVDVVAEQFAECCRRGERPSVSDYANRHPDIADQLREILPPIALMEKLKTRNRSGSANGGASRPLQIERLGDFRIVREIGRGGMGIVFEARQESLGRHVALKVLSRASLLDPQRVLRFEQEARAAAGLHHTNIVPVFGVGHDDGLHYYAMQFISGRTLADVIASLADAAHPAASNSANTPSASAAAPTQSSPAIPPRGKRYWTWVADVGRQVADALQYAHRQGILHRDVKPANLLLDDRGNVWITDFGLAKFASLPNNVTQTGDVIGTLQYLAPEALKSESDSRGDIYSLGLSLYEMLTLQPAFHESNPAVLIRKVAETDPARPRKINPRIPQDLENVILKAIARDPAARYASAADLALDLDNFIHDRPINARRAHAGQRLWRWCRRNRVVASLGSIAAASFVAALVMGWIAYGTTRRALTDEANRRTEAEMARRLADANVALSLKSFEDIFNSITADGSQPPPPNGAADPKRTQKESQDARVLKSILTFYDQFAGQNTTNGQLEAEAARAYRRVGDSYFWLWQDAAADTAYRRAAAIFASLAHANPEATAYSTGFVEATLRLAARQARLNRDDADLIHRGTEIAQTLAGGQPANAYLAELSAQMMLRDGQILRSAGDTAAAEARFRSAISAWKSARPAGLPGPRGRPGGPPPRPMQCTEAWLELSDLMAATHRQPDARAALREALDELQRESRDLPGNETQLADSFYTRIATAADSLGAADVATRARRPRPREAPMPDGPMRRRPGDFPPPDGPGRPPLDGPPDGPRLIADRARCLKTR